MFNAAGAMIWMVFTELIPDALEKVSGARAGAAVTLAFAALFSFPKAAIGSEIEIHAACVE